MPIQHVIFSKIDNPNDAKVLGAIKEGCGVLRKIPGVLSVTAGPNYTQRGGGYNYGFIVTFESKQAEKEYQSHPDHLRVIKEIIGPLISKDPPVLAIDFDDTQIMKPSASSSSSSSAKPTAKSAIPNTAQKPLLVVMRHSVRKDKDPKCSWSDKNLRPYDTPISDFKLPADQAEVMRQRGFGFDLILSSPFRRCLQTAAVVAHKLGVKRIQVLPSIGEKRSAVKRCQRDVWGEDRLADGNVTDLDTAEMLEILKEVSGKTLTAIEETKGDAKEDAVLLAQPGADESDQESLERMQAAFKAACTKYLAQGERILAVTHGDAVDASVRAFLPGKVVYDCPECGWAAFEVASQGKSPTLVAKSRIATI